MPKRYGQLKEYGIGPSEGSTATCVQLSEVHQKKFMTGHVVAKRGISRAGSRDIPVSLTRFRIAFWLPNRWNTTIWSWMGTSLSRLTRGGPIRLTPPSCTSRQSD